MNREQLLKELNLIFINIFEDESILLKDTTTTDDIETWDSLTHIQMITAVEKRYKIRFDLNELLNLKNVGDLCNAVLKAVN